MNYRDRWLRSADPAAASASGVPRTISRRVRSSRRIVRKRLGLARPPRSGRKGTRTLLDGWRSRGRNAARGLRRAPREGARGRSGRDGRQALSRARSARGRGGRAGAGGGVAVSPGPSWPSRVSGQGRRGPFLVVWLRNIVGIRRVGRSGRTPGGSTASSERPGQEERPDALDPPQRPHHPGRAGRDRPLRRAHRRAGQALRGQHRDRSQVAQARARGLPRPFRSSAQAALEGERGGARRGVRPAPRDRLPARRPHLRGPALPAAPGPRQRLPHPQGRGPEPADGPRAREAAASSRSTSSASCTWT